ncbi:MAG: tetratricopeptide repeat protein [Desulfobaccales bacterium]|nr:tetratricopeptide repeat protein [Desulfobaccales bacterium]
MRKFSAVPIILGFIALLLLLGNLALAQNPAPLAEADDLMTIPTLDVPQASRALALYEESLPNAGADRPLLLAKLARVCFILGDISKDSTRQGFYAKGRTYAEMLLKEQPAGVPGHYWLALNLCGLADVGGAFQGRELLPTILEELQRSLTIDETYDQAGAHRVLGRIYFEAPGRPLSVGDLNKSLQHLTAAVRLAPENSTNHLYLAETLLRLGNPDQARQQLEQTLKATQHAIHPGGLTDDQTTAQRRLEEMGG